MPREISMNYENIKKNTVILLSKAKQSKAKPLLYLLTNNLNFYISQFFKAFNFLNVLFGFAKILSLRANFTEGVPLALAWQSIMFGLLRSFHSLAMTVKNNFAILINKGFALRLFGNPLVLTSINSDNLSEKIKNLRLVINFKFINSRRYSHEEYQKNF